MLQTQEQNTETQSPPRHWYAIHTYAGYEDRVSESLRQRIKSLAMEDKVFNVLVPTEKRIKIRNGVRRTVIEKIFPGYVFVDMTISEDSWYVVRNTPNVTGFIGTGVIPTPLSEEEMKEIQKRMGLEEPKYKIEFKIGDPIKIIDGPFNTFEGKVSSIDDARGKVKVLILVFGRETPVELDFLQIKKI